MERASVLAIVCIVTLALFAPTSSVSSDSIGSTIMPIPIYVLERKSDRRYLDFDSRTDLEYLEARDKNLHDKVRSIINEIRAVPSTDVPRWLRAKYGAEHGSVATSLWRVSYPPLATLSFELEGIRFSGTVRVYGFPADLQYWQRQKRPNPTLKATPKSGVP